MGQKAERKDLEIDKMRQEVIDFRSQLESKFHQVQSNEEEIAYLQELREDFSTERQTLKSELVQ